MRKMPGSALSYTRLRDALLLILLVICVPHVAVASTLWQSTTTHDDSIQIYTPGMGHSWFNGTQDAPVIQLGIWDTPDFTSDASTSVYVWTQWNGGVDQPLDFILSGSIGADPFYSGGTSTARFVGSLGRYYPIVQSSTSTLEESIIPANRNETIHHGDVLWAFLVPSWASYGANYWIGGASTTPFVKICEGDCDAPPATTTPLCTQDCNDNVLFLPGIESSRLYRPQVVGNPENKLWEPQRNTDVQQLYLNPDGSSVRPDIYTKEGDVLDEQEFSGVNVYKSFITRMNGLKTAGTIADWKSAPYDWRLSLDDILSYGNHINGHLYYSGDLRATSTPYIIQELRQLAKTSRTGKVTIVAHSNGGLVAKRLTQILGSEATALINKIIFVAVPQMGTPAAIAVGEHGYDQALGAGLILDKRTARTFAQNAPTEYQLLPSESYFTWVDDPVVSFDASLPDWIARYGSKIHSAVSLHTFLTDTYGRVDPALGDINTPVQMNGTLLSNAEVLHTSLDAWTPPTGVKFIQIAGWGVPTTVSGITYKKHGLGITYDANTTIDGDGTVVAPSALLVSTTTGVEDYWLDLGRYNKQHLLETGGGTFPFAHKDLLEVPQLRDFLADQITAFVQPITSYTYLTKEIPASTARRLHFTLHSPLTLNAYDGLGHHTGISTTTGQIEQQIPGTYYAEFGETKHIFSDAGLPLHISMSGYASGTFTLSVDELQGDALTASSTFKDVPTTASTTVVLDVGAGVSTLSPMHIDANGDGLTDYNLTPKLNGTVTLDTTPPEINITFSTSTNALAFIGIDDMGTSTVTATTSYPTAKKNKKGKDDDDRNKSVATTTITARDAAGNTTALVYTEQIPFPDQRDTVTLQTITYNAATTTLTNSSISYKWRFNKDTTYKLFASYIRTVATTTESHYRPKKNITVLMTKPTDLNDAEEDTDSDIRPTKQAVPEMVIPYIRTEKGRMIIAY